MPDSYLLIETRGGNWQQHSGRPAGLAELQSPSGEHLDDQKSSRGGQQAQRSRRPPAAVAAEPPAPMAADATAVAGTPACARRPAACGPHSQREANGAWACLSLRFHCRQGSTPSLVLARPTHGRAVAAAAQPGGVQLQLSSRIAGHSSRPGRRGTDGLASADGLEALVVHWGR